MYVIKVNDKYLRIYTNPEKTYHKVGFFLAKFVDLQQATVYSSKKDVATSLNCLITELDRRTYEKKSVCIEFELRHVQTRRVELKLVTPVKT